MARGKCRKIAEASQTPTALDVAWTAGFIEGDGHIGRNGTGVEIDVTQKQAWPLERLQVLFGGTLGTIHNQGLARRTYWRWRVSGDRARDLATLIFPYLSPEKQAQVMRFYE